MSVLGKLASALGRSDEQPNVELAEALAIRPDAAAIAELAGALASRSTAVSNDAIKVLYELDERKPELVAPHTQVLLALLSGKNNRNIWGALQAIETIAALQPDAVLAELPGIITAADRGSVIAKDKAVAILVKLAAAGHGATVLPLLLQRLEGAAPNQFPMYAEAVLPVIDAAHRAAFVRLLETRLTGIEASAKRTRVEKVLRRARA